MKKLFVILILFLALLLPVFSFAAGTATIVPSNIAVLNYVQRKVLTISVVSGSSGAYTDSTINTSTYQVNGWYLYSVETTPGTGTVPNSYSVVIKDTTGFDLAGGLLATRSTTLTQLVNLASSSFGYPIVTGNLTLGITGMGVTSSTTTIVIIFIAQ